MPTGLAAEKNLKRTSGTLGWYNCRRTAVVLHDAFESYTATFRAKPFGCKRYLHKCMITNNTFVIRPVCAPVSVLVRVKVFAADCSPLESRLHTLIHQPRYCFVQAASTWGEWYTTWETTGIVCVCVCVCQWHLKVDVLWWWFMAKLCWDGPNDEVISLNNPTFCLCLAF